MWGRIVTSIVIFIIGNVGIIVSSILRARTIEEAIFVLKIINILCLIFSILYVSGVIFNR